MSERATMTDLDSAVPASDLLALARGTPLLRVVEASHDGRRGRRAGETRYVIAVPVDLEALVARALAERVPPRPLAAPHQRLRFAGWELDLVERRLVAPDGGVATLPGLEFSLLKELAAAAQRPVARSMLAMALSRSSGTRITPRTVDSYVSRVRARLRRGGAEALIVTVPRFGYSLAAAVDRP